MSANKSWYETGYAGAEKEQERRDLGAAPRRFWLKVGASKEIVFIDDSPFCIWEHSWRVGDDKNFQYATCISKINPEGCPGDAAKGVQKAEYIGHYTIVDVTGYVSKDGKEHKYELVELSPKTKVLNKLKAKKEAKGSLVGQLFQVLRTDDNSASTGDDFEHKREVDMVKLYEVVSYKGKKLKDMIDAANNPSDPTSARVRRYLAHHFQIPETGEIPASVPPFNYANVHAPMEPAAMRAAMSGARGFQANGSSGGSSGGTQTDDVPF
jgi:hypothetical protein